MPLGPPNRARVREGLLLALVSIAWPVELYAVVGDRDGVFGVDGSVRMIGVGSANYDSEAIFGPDNPADGQGQMLLRFVAGGYPTDWLDYEVHVLETVTASSASGGVTGGLASAGSGVLSGLRYRTLDTRWIQASGDFGARLDLDRLNLRFRAPWFDLSLGRQALSFGKAYFWNPLDVFLAFQPFQFDRDYKSGVDALRLDVPFGDFSGLNLIAHLGRPESAARWFRSAALVRVFTNHWDWDFSIQGGKVFGGYHLGAGASGEAGAVEVRAEAAYFWAQENPTPLIAQRVPQAMDALTMVLGVGHRFESSLLLEAEYLFNDGARGGLTEGFALLSSGRLLNASKHVVGLLASYELTPLLMGSVAILAGTPASAASDISVLLQPGIRYSAADEVELVAGALLALGERPSSGSVPVLKTEFGTYPHILYVETKIYF